MLPDGTPEAGARATRRGFVAVLFWTSLASLTAVAGPIPPFQLSAITFAIGSVVGVLWSLARGQALDGLKTIRPASLALGVYGLLLFHVCYFLALQRLPVVEASLIIYLWPLLIVLFSGLLPAGLGGRGLGWTHVCGALLGLAGSALILSDGVLSAGVLSAGGAARSFGGGPIFGYLMAAAAAFIWASYSVGSRLLAHVPSSAVTANCAATAVGALILHLVFETPAWPQSTAAWCAMAALGAGPVGLAFYLWDEGMKNGNIRLLGVASYATPLLSTLLLAALGLGRASAGLWLAALLIAAGALLAGWDQLRRNAEN